MLKKTIEYEDFDGNKIVEDFYFNLTKAELSELEMEENGGLSNYIQQIVDEKDAKKIIQIFKDIILRSYGKKSEDGKRFIKTKEMAEEFSQTNAFSELFVKLAYDSQEAADFINGIIPAGLNTEKQQEKPAENRELLGPKQ